MNKVYQTKKLSKNIKDTIVKDDNGYYRVHMGRFNDYNSRGIFYRVTDIDAVLGEGSIVHRRLEEGLLRAELNHPDVKGLSGPAFRQRVLKIDLKNTIAHIKKIEVIPTGEINKEFNLPTYDVYGWIKPEAPLGDKLKDILENPDANLAMSIRSLVYQKRIGTTVVRDVVLVSTWDVVGEPGISKATQWTAAGLEESESLDGIIDSTEDIKELITAFEESATTCPDGKCVIDCLGNLVKKESNPLFNIKL